MPTQEANAKSLGYQCAAQKFVSAYTAQKHGNCKTEVLYFDGMKHQNSAFRWCQHADETEMERNIWFRATETRR